jgi:hypothetical protein
VLPTLRLAIAASNRREPGDFRIIGYSTQYDHMHMLVEASNQRTLSAGMRSVAIRIARMVNRLVGRRGRFWADRWHGRALTSPRQVRTAWVYVLANFRKHSRRRLAPGIDPYSSGIWFDGWLGGPGAPKAPLGAETRSERAPPLCEPGNEPMLASLVPIRRPETWLARVGWRRHGPLRLDESPAGTLPNV